VDSVKVQGNDALKRGDFTEAEVRYTQAMAQSPADIHTLYSNRSLARLRRGNKQGALADANQCIHTAPTFVKGYHRKGAALEALSRLDEAAQAYKEGYEIEGIDAKEKNFMMKRLKQLSTNRKHDNKENPNVGSRQALANAVEDVKKWQAQAKAGDTEAIANLGTAYATGYGVKKDLETATAYWHRAAKAGSVSAQHNYGSHIGTAQGKEWLMLAAAKGNLDSYLQLADFYNSENNQNDELVWLVKAADEHNSMEAQTRAAVCYFNLGKTSLAAQYFCKASSQMESTDPEFGTIQQTLGDLYVNGTGVPKDTRKGVKYLESAVAAGSADALFAIHEMYCAENMIADAKAALARVDAEPCRTAEQCHMVGCAHFLHAQLFDPVDVSQLRTAELRWKMAINRGHTDSAVQLAESAALRGDISLCNDFLRIYVDSELVVRGRFFENMKLNGEKFASAVLKTRAELHFTTALIYCSVARDLSTFAMDQVRMVEKLTSKEHIQSLLDMHNEKQRSGVRELKAVESDEVKSLDTAVVSTAEAKSSQSVACADGEDEERDFVELD